MEIVLALIALVAAGAIIYANREARSLDVNKDGKVDIADAKEVVKKTKAVAKKTTEAVKEKVTKPKTPKLKAAK